MCCWVARNHLTRELAGGQPRASAWNRSCLLILWTRTEQPTVSFSEPDERNLLWENTQKLMQLQLAGREAGCSVYILSISSWGLCVCGVLVRNVHCQPFNRCGVAVEMMGAFVRECEFPAFFFFSPFNWLLRANKLMSSDWLSHSLSSTLKLHSLSFFHFSSHVINKPLIWIWHCFHFYTPPPWT